MKLKLRYSNKVIFLPDEHDVQKRILLVKSILENYPEEFHYCEDMFYIKNGSRIDINYRTKINLDILGRYIIQGEDNYTDSVMSRYKETNRPLQEMPFSQFDRYVPELQDQR